MAEPRLEGPDFDEERVDAMWTLAAPRILVRERKRRGQRWALGAGALVAAAAALLLALPWAPPASPLLEGSSILTAEQPSSFSLRDGSRVEAGEETSIQVERHEAEAVRLDLARGRARFVVSKRRPRQFSVVAGDVTVRVVGTRFWVSRRGEQVRVEVEEGTVEVRYQEQVIALPAPGSWERPSRPAEAPRGAELLAPGAAPAEVPAPAEELEPALAEEEDLAPAEETAPPRARSHEPQRAPSKPKSRAAERSRREAADRMFQAAMQARAGGDGRAALVAFEAFLTEHPRDTRAALASFELGRLQMDVAHDPEAAARSLNRALSASPTASFAEDALARLVRAHAQRGDAGACRDTRARYERQYPAGAYAKSLASLCP